MSMVVRIALSTKKLRTSSQVGHHLSFNSSHHKSHGVIRTIIVTTACLANFDLVRFELEYKRSPFELFAYTYTATQTSWCVWSSLIVDRWEEMTDVDGLVMLTTVASTVIPCPLEKVRADEVPGLTWDGSCKTEGRYVAVPWGYVGKVEEVLGGP